MELRDLSSKLFTKRLLVCEYGQVELADGKLLFHNTQMRTKAKVNPKELETVMVLGSGEIKYQPFALNKMRKNIRVNVRRTVNRQFDSITITRDDYTHEGKPLDKGVVVLMCNPPRFYMDKETLVTETRIVEKPDFNLTSADITEMKNKVSGKVSKPRVEKTQDTSNTFKGSDKVVNGKWSCVSVLMERTQAGGLKRWGYLLSNGDNSKQVDIQTTMKMADNGEIENLMLVKENGGEPFLKGNGIKLENLKQVLKQ